jgi:hypothetical protein
MYMIIKFPEPQVTVEARLVIDKSLADGILRIAEEKGISGDLVCKAFIEAAYSEYKNPTIKLPVMPKPGNSTLILPTETQVKKNLPGPGDTASVAVAPTVAFAPVDSEKTPGKRGGAYNKLPPGKWAVKHDACIKCGSTNKKHMGKGLCTTCYFLKEPIKTQEEPKEEAQRPNSIANKYTASQLREDANIKSMVITCPFISCAHRIRFVSGTGVKWEDKEYCHRDCMQAAYDARQRALEGTGR